MTLPKNEELSRVRVHGDCMAGAGIYDGDTIVVDFDRVPRENAPCLCRVDGRLMVKRFLKVMPNGVFAVSTCYDLGGQLYVKRKNGSYLMDCGYFTPEVLGVVLACLAPNGDVRWSSDYRGFAKSFAPPQNKTANLVAKA